MILKYYNWHEVFLITGAVGFIWLIFWLLLYDIPSRQKRLTAEEYEYIISDTGMKQKVRAMIIKQR